MEPGGVSPPASPPAEHLPKVPVMVTDTPLFRKEKHIKYWMRCLKSPLPHQYTSNDSNRMTLAFFTLSALDLLGALFTKTTPEERQEYSDWIYSCQISEGGFRAFPGTDFGDRANVENGVWDPANLPATYFALSALCILRDDLQRVNREGCLDWLRRIQRPDGSFGQTLGEDGKIEGGTDSRFAYCGMVVRWILRGCVEGEVEGIPDIDVDNLVDCITRCQTYDGGISDQPFHEAHAGYTHCTVTALKLVNRLSSRSLNMNPELKLPANARTLSEPAVGEIVRWLLSRLTTWIEEDEEEGKELEDALSPHAQSEISGSSGPMLQQDSHTIVLDETPCAESASIPWAGCNGRPNKVADTCYVFWVGASLSVLQAFDLITYPPVRRYLLEKTQHLIGGFGKYPGDSPDIYHAYLGLAVLSLTGVGGANGECEEIDPARTEKQLEDLDAALCVSVGTRRWIESFSWHRVAR